MCLVAASVGRHKAVRPRTDGIPAWPLHQVPSAMMQCSVEMPSGHTLFPFADSPHITQEGFIIHGSNPEPGPKSIACYYIVRSQATLEKQPERSLTIFNGFGKTMSLYRFSPSQHFNISNIGRPRPLPNVGPLCGSLHNQRGHSCRVPYLILKFFSGPLRDGQESTQRKSAQPTRENFPSPQPFQMTVLSMRHHSCVLRKKLQGVCHLLKRRQAPFVT